MWVYPLSQDRQISEEGRIVDRDTRYDCGTPNDWGKAVVASQRQQVMRIFLENELKMISVVIPVPFEHHYLLFREKVYEIAKMTLDLDRKSVV